MPSPARLVSLCFVCGASGVFSVGAARVGFVDGGGVGSLLCGPRWHRVGVWLPLVRLSSSVAPVWAVTPQIKMVVAVVAWFVPRSS